MHSSCAQPIFDATHILDILSIFMVAFKQRGSTEQHNATKGGGMKPPLVFHYTWRLPIMKTYQVFFVNCFFLTIFSGIALCPAFAVECGKTERSSFDPNLHVRGHGESETYHSDKATAEQEAIAACKADIEEKVKRQLEDNFSADHPGCDDCAANEGCDTPEHCTEYVTTKHIVRNGGVPADTCQVTNCPTKRTTAHLPDGTPVTVLLYTCTAKGSYLEESLTVGTSYRVQFGCTECPRESEDKISIGLCTADMIQAIEQEANILQDLVQTLD